MCGHSIGETWFPFTQGCFVLSLVENGALVPEDGEEEENVYDYDDGILWSESSLEPSAQLS